MNCAGSVDAAKGAPDDESIYAAEGTAAHYLSELARKENKRCVGWLGVKFKVGKYAFTVDEDMAASAQEFVDWCEEDSDGVPLVEQRIGYSEWFAASTIEKYGAAFGTLDDARLNDAIVHIKDFKHGKGVQEFAEWNTQLLLQALGVLNDFGHLYDIKGFKLSICQPRLDHKDSWECSTESLLNWAEGLKADGAAIEAGTQFKAGAWCRFCRIRKTCAVRANSAIQVMLDEGEFEDLDAPALEMEAMRARNGLQHISTARLAEIYPMLDIMKAWIKDVESLIVFKLISNEVVGDLKLVEGRSNRKWLSTPEKLAQKIADAGVEPYEPQKLKSVAVVEGEVGKKAFAAAFAKDADWQKPKGKPKLVPGDDRRTAMTTTTLEEFENLDAD